tara:strand:+ start:2032 stop:3129 length:1098 start_codon:yes stop_codon:yes gene_type:complete
MASTFKDIKPSDRVSTRTLLHEAIPITGTIVSGTYGTFPNDDNIKNFAHGMFQSVYDYPYLSSSANHIFDITCGYSSDSSLFNSSYIQNSKKRNIYNQMAQVCVGYDITGSVLRFDEDGDILAGGAKIKEGYFVNFTRLLVKDEIKKGTVSLTVGVTASYSSPMGQTVTITDAGGVDDYRVNSPVGEYGVLYASGAAVDSSVTSSTFNAAPCGLVYYQAGVMVLSASLFKAIADGGILTNTNGTSEMNPSGESIEATLTGSEISGNADNLRHRLKNIQFNNTVELNSTIYFCRANHNEFNYSSNPTYLSSSQIRVKQISSDEPISYITTVGLYSENNELLAVGKLSEPLKKTPANEFTIRARLDY